MDDRAGWRAEMGMTVDAAEAPVTAPRSGKSQAAFRTISEVADELDVAQHVLRFWESKFPQVRPLKRGGGRRYYRPEDIDLLRDIRALLYDEGYTIKGAQKLLRQRRARPPAMPVTRTPAAQSPAPALLPDPPPAGAADRPQQHRLGDTTPTACRSRGRSRCSRRRRRRPSPKGRCRQRPRQVLRPSPWQVPVSPPGAAREDVERLREVRESLVASARNSQHCWASAAELPFVRGPPPGRHRTRAPLAADRATATIAGRARDR
jgi:DNA-binding transcriptional MerR regulator